MSNRHGKTTKSIVPLWPYISWVIGPNGYRVSEAADILLQKDLWFHHLFRLNKIICFWKSFYITLLLFLLETGNWLQESFRHQLFRDVRILSARLCKGSHL